MNVVRIEQEALSLTAQFIELGNRECTMNIELAEPSALRTFKVLQNQSDQIRKVRVVGATEKITFLSSGKGMPAGEEVEELIRVDVLQGAGASEGVGEEFVP